jgi:glycosyltransferase involved in cell wall biosynthesis
MRVLYLVPPAKRPERIGAYTFLDEEIHALSASGIEAYVLSTLTPQDAVCGNVRVISVDARTSLTEELDTAAFIAKHAAAIPRGNLFSPRALYRCARIERVAADFILSENIDVIHSHFAWPKGFGGLMARAATGRPLVACLQGTDILMDRSIGYGRRADQFFDRAVRLLLATADRTVYFSAFMRDQAVALGARPDAARVIRKGVDLDLFTVADDPVELRQQLGLGSRPMILTVAGLIRRKGIDDILEALARLRDELDFTLVVCGVGPERAALEALSSRLGLAGRVVFAGQVDRRTVSAYFAACDVFVLASLLEAVGNVLLEAMAAGRPVVSTDSGGPPEYVTHGKTGFVVPARDHVALAARLRLLLESPSLRSVQGQAGHRRAVSEFGFDRMVCDLIELYRDVLDSREQGALSMPSSDAR